MQDVYDQPLCAMCDKPSTQLCGGCSSIKYCSRACQKGDWPTHKLVCKTFTDFIATRPSPEHHAAIYFPMKETNLRFVWLRYNSAQVLDTNHAPTAEFAHLGISQERLQNARHKELGRNPELGRHIQDRHIVMSLLNTMYVHKDTCTQILAKVNKDLASIYRGHIVIWARNCQNGRSIKAYDLGPMDFRHIVDQMRFDYYKLDLVEQSFYQQMGSVQGVRLNCDGDHKFLDRSTLEAVLEPLPTLRAVSDIPTPVADAVGLPLVVRRVQPSLVWRDRNIKTYKRYHNASMLNPPHQTEDTGSLVIIRKDGYPLHPDHLLALSGYAAVTLVDPARPKDACIPSHMLQPERIVHLSRADFKKFYASEWKKTLRGRALPSPYDLAGLDAFDGFSRSINFKDQRGGSGA